MFSTASCGIIVDLGTLLSTLGVGLTDAVSQSSEPIVRTNGMTKVLTLSVAGYTAATAPHVMATTKMKSQMLFSLVFLHLMKEWWYFYQNNLYYYPYF